MSGLVETVRGDVLSTRDAFVSCVPAGSGISFEQEAEFAIQSLMNNDYALGIATRSPAGRQSVINAVKNVAAIGVSLNPARKQAYLVPRLNRICLDISYMGLLDIAMQSGSIRWGQAKVVYQQDYFEDRGIDKEPVHRRQPFAPDRGPVVGVFVTVKTNDGDYLTETMTVNEINDIRARSESAKKGKGPWVTDWTEMAKKTVVKRAYKYWPKTDRLGEAIHYLNNEGGEGLAPAAEEATLNADEEVLAKWRTRINAANTPDELAAIWREAAHECKAMGNKGLHGAIKQLVIECRDALEQKTVEGEVIR